MKAKDSVPAGVVVVASLSAGLVGLGVFLGASALPAERAARAHPAAMSRPAVTTAEPTVAPTSALAPATSSTDGGATESADDFVRRLLDLLGTPSAEGDDDEVNRIVSRLLALGEGAAPALLAGLDRTADVGRHDRLLDVLRKVPGQAAEDRLVREARRGDADSTRAIAIESLAERKTERAVSTLGDIARTDPKLPARPLITSPRDPSDPSTELPDEVVFTPRMQAMVALASTKDPSAAGVLTDVLVVGPDDSLRMQAASSLGDFRTDPSVARSLAGAASRDLSPYVRLAALHALDGSSDPSVLSVVEGIARSDPDTGVRNLALQVLARAKK